MSMIARALVIVSMMVTLVSASAFVVLPELDAPAPKQRYFGPSAFASLEVPAPAPTSIG
ncbi:hypothetical protein [Roseixanthobacter glucoisosaccharinicivorans]|uniref:hypothetical protein n=1 Tax=Roseixanthobacter glucoisosaccharinicivorans TaxID=3119923 RepID=UPI00372A2638